MNKNALTCAATITAYILGIATGILVVKDCMERKFKKRSEDEIQSVKDAFEERLKKRTERSAEESEKINDIYKRLLEQSHYKAEETPEKQETASAPVVIPPEEFDDNQDYDNYTITYYEKSGVFTDDADTPIDDTEVAKALGVQILRHFGEYEDDRICVRNDNQRAYYEVLLDEGEYEP